MENTDVPYSCKHFAQAIFLYLYEIDSNYWDILLSIGREVEPEIRTRKGLGRTIGRLANVFYGAALDLDIESTFKSVVKLVQSKCQNINIPENQI